MPTATETQQFSFTDEGFQAFLDSRTEPAWLSEMRANAWQRFNEMAWPSNKDEEWMRTDIRMFHLDKFQLPGKRSEVAALQPVLTEGVELAGSSASCDGVAAREANLDPELAAKGVIFGNLAQLVPEHGDLIRKHLFQTVGGSIDRFAALHQASWSNGLFLYVPRNVVIEKPFHTFATLTDGGSDFSHTLIVLEEGAEATVLAESANAEGQSGLHCGAIEIVVGDRANLRYVNLQDWSQKVWHFAHQKAVVGRDANLQWTVGALGSRLSQGQSACCPPR